MSPQAKGQPWRNQEFVPEKWGRGGSKDWKIIANDLSSTHLLSYNEPDHGEQSNVSVEQALEEWPKHLESGLRLGSPATTDFSWLYRFMDGCRERNYRVDYVAIHAYWGGSGSSVQVTSVKDWYNKLKEIHEKQDARSGLQSGITVPIGLMSHGRPIRLPSRRNNAPLWKKSSP